MWVTGFLSVGVVQWEVVLCVTHVWAVATFLYFILAECPPFGWVPSIPFES